MSKEFSVTFENGSVINFVADDEPAAGEIVLAPDYEGSLEGFYALRKLYLEAEEREKKLKGADSGTQSAKKGLQT